MVFLNLYKVVAVFMLIFIFLCITSFKFEKEEHFKFKNKKNSAVIFNRIKNVY